MILQNFDPVTNSLDDFVSFCKRLKQADTVSDPANNSRSTKSNKNSTTTASGSKSKRKCDGWSSKDCLIHGRNCGHTSHECTTIKAQAQNMRATYNAQTKEGKKKLQEKHELNALVAEAVSKALVANKKKRRAACTETEQELNVLNNL